MQYLHQQKILHRDIKPENILLSDGHTKISDFGVSRVVSSRAVTKIGTPHYMAREMFESNSYDMSVDIWALGILFLEMLLDKRIYQLLEGEEVPAKR